MDAQPPSNTQRWPGVKGGALVGNKLPVTSDVQSEVGKGGSVESKPGDELIDQWALVAMTL